MVSRSSLSSSIDTVELSPSVRTVPPLKVKFDVEMSAILSLCSVIWVRSNELTSTVSEKLKWSWPALRSKVNDSMAGEVVSSVKTLTASVIGSSMFMLVSSMAN